MDVIIGINNRKENFSGLEVAIATNQVEKNAKGMCNAIVMNDIGGNAIGVYNAGLATYIKGKLKGLSFVLGLNYANSLRGVQISLLLNICGEDSIGIQVGLVNYRKSGKWYSRFFPLIAIRTCGHKYREKKAESKGETTTKKKS